MPARPVLCAGRALGKARAILFRTKGYAHDQVPQPRGLHRRASQLRQDNPYREAHRRAGRSRLWTWAASSTIAMWGSTSISPGKDSWRHRHAGASETVIAAPGQMATYPNHRWGSGMRRHRGEHARPRRGDRRGLSQKRPAHHRDHARRQQGRCPNRRGVRRGRSQRLGARHGFHSVRTRLHALCR